MLDLKTLKTIDEALDMALDNLVENNAFKSDSPYAQRFYMAQKKVRSEIAKSKKVRKLITKNNTYIHD